MYQKNMIAIKHIILIIYIILCHCLILSSLSCSAATNSSAQDREQRFSMMKQDAVESKDEFTHNYSKVCDYVGSYSALTFTKFQDIRNGSDTFSTISITYRDLSEYNQNGEPLQLRLLDIDNGFAGVEQNINSIETYNVSLKRNCDPSLQLETGYFEADASPELVNEVFDYISLPANQAYFFNNDEFEGLEQPYSAPRIWIDDGNYIFVVSFSETTDLANDWVISKCIDEPNEIWQGLIDILEENFISQFE